MKLIILPTDYPNIYNDHTAIFVEDQAETLAKEKNIDAQVLGALPISFKDIWKKKLFKFGNFTLEKNGVKAHLFLFPSIPKLKIFNQFARHNINKILYKNYLKKNQIDMIHVHNATAGKTALWMKKKHDISYCVTEHSSNFARNLLSKTEIKSFEDIYKNSSANIAVSREFANLLNSIYKLTFEYIPNVVDTKYFACTAKKEKEIFNFINIGNLNKNKNQILLIQAFAKAFQNQDNIRLSILGDGLEYNNLQREIDKLNMNNQIKLFGFAKRGQVLSELQSSDAFVLSSDYETFGVVLIEAMSCGLPVVATKCGGPESIIVDRKLGVLVNKGVNALAYGMKHIYETEYNRTDIREHIVKNFSEKVVAERLMNIYKKVLHEV